MHSFKKTIIVSVSFLLMLALLSGIVLFPSLYTETQNYMDSNLRDNLSGELDTLIVGSSHCLTGLSPEVMDSKLGCNSYNLSNTMMTMDGRRAMLEKELQRNPVDTVILELSYNAMTRNEAEDGANGDAITFARLDTARERFAFLRECGATKDFTRFYSKLLVEGVSAWSKVLIDKSIHNVDYSTKGFHPASATDQKYGEDEIQDNYQVGALITDYRKDNIEAFCSIIDLCKSYDTDVIVVVLPVSDNILWQLTGWDIFRCWTEDFCEDNGCRLIDMNLLKNRNELFSIKHSFLDDIHLSSDGACACTTQLAEIISNINCGKDVSNMFYETYMEMIDNLPYNQFLGQNA